MSCSSKPPVYDVTKEKEKVIQQAVIPLLGDLESLFAGLSTDVPGITEEDKIDIGIMPRAIHILMSYLRVQIDMLASQTFNAEHFATLGPLSPVIATILSDIYQVI